MKIVAITGCPTGIAHTYMAAEALRESAGNLEHEIKVETQGLEVENTLTKQDIKEADIVIIASGKKIEKGRFVGKKLHEMDISHVMRNSNVAINEAFEKAVVYQEELETDLFAGVKVDGAYKHLMNGVGYMLPFVVSGGIIIAMSFAFGINAANPEDPSYNIIAQILSDTGGGAAFAMMLPALAAGISYSISKKAGITAGAVAGMMAISTNSGFLGAMVGGFLAGYVTNFLIKHIKLGTSYSVIKGILLVPLLSVLITGFSMATIIGIPISLLLEVLTSLLTSLSGASAVVLGLVIGTMMAIDMGGPFNKTVSVFSIGLMASGINEPIAACMVAGMTPPLGIALSTIISKRKYTKQEIETGKVNWILGLSYITEGAIPFAVTDPFRVIPSIVVGSATAAAMSMYFGCGSLAPHGGIWVIMVPNVITNLLMYILAIITGTVVTALMLALLKKNKNIGEKC